jgi:transposase
LANVLSDVSGITGQAIVKAILAGERDPHQLVGFRDCRVKASEEEIARSLEGNWQEDLLFVLKSGTGWLRVLPEADGGVRSAAAAVSQARGRPERRGQFAGREAEGAAQEEKEGEVPRQQLPREPH